MSYTTPAEFLLRAFPSGSFNSISTGSIQTALDVAAADIDCALRTHHTLPLSSTPENIKDAEVVIASYRLMLHVGFAPPGNDEVLIQRYNEITGPEGWLDRVAKGKLIFDSDIDATPTVHEGRPRTFSSSTRRRITNRRFNDDGDEIL